MNPQRLSAKEAIAALKAHQLKTVNAGILDEIKAIKDDFKDWKLSFDETRKDVTEATEKFKEVLENISKHNERLSQLETGQKSCVHELRSLQTSRATLDETVSKIVGISDAMKQEHQNIVDNLRGELVQLSNKIRELEEWEIQVTDELRRDIAERGGKVNVDELEERLEDFIRDVNTRFQEIQKDTEVAGNLVNLCTYERETRHGIDDASPPAGPVHLTTSPRQDSNEDRWKPIDTQVALRATPPPQPETLPFINRREDSHVQTPSTLRSVGLTRQDISNINHTRPVEMGDWDHAHRQDPPSERPADVSQLRVVANTLGREPETSDWDLLIVLLKLQQEEGETLTHYLARFRALTARLGPNQDVVSACLRRFVNGVVNDQRKAFMREWLMTSEWTLDNLGDCVLLLTKYSAHRHTIRAQPELDAPVNGEISAVQDHVHDGLQFADEACPVVDENNSPAKLLEDPHKEVDFPAGNADNRQRTQPARAAKARKTVTGRVAKRPRKKSTKKVSRGSNIDGQQPPNEGPALNEQVIPQVEADSIPENLTPPQPAQKLKARCGRVGKNELQSLLNTRIIEKATDAATQNLKRKTLHQAEEGIPQTPSANNTKSRQPPKSRVTLPARRIPRLVPRNVARPASVADGSDVYDLPPVPAGLDGQEEDSAGEKLENLARKRIRKTKPELPVLALTASDFQD